MSDFNRPLIILVSLLLMTGCLDQPKPYPWLEHSSIAHAAGGIDNITYTNSLEAFHHNYSKGFKLFEIDITITRDGSLVARHGWDEDLGQDIGDKTLPLNYDEFMQLPYHSLYTPLDFKMVLELMKEYPDIYVILDGKVSSVDDTEELYKKIGKEIEDIDEDILNRLVPQIFYEEDLDIIRKYGFYEVIYVVGREHYTSKSLTKFCEENDVRAVSLSRNRANKEIIQTLSESNIFTYVYTINDKSEMDFYTRIGVNGFFTDFLFK